MTSELTHQREHERQETLWQVAVLDVTRHLIRAGATHLDAALTWAALAAEASQRAEQQGALAVSEGESDAEVARALGISRQAAARRYRHLSAV